jgi:WD40 repeat protein
LDKLLQLATSPTFQLLSKRESAYRLCVPEYVTEWQELKTWVSNEQKAFKQFKLFEEIALEYFKGTGLLLGKDRLDKALLLKEEIFTTYAWEEKYKLDKELFSSFLLLSQNYHEELLKTQRKKRASLLKNSIRISIAVGIAFLLSSFTALLAYLERNTAVEQQELAIKSKEEAEQARIVAEKERLEAVAARENEQSALQVAEAERLIAIESRGQAEVQRLMAVDALILAKKSEQEASVAKDAALQNAKIANEATLTAQINFENSEKLKNQQEARASALEALGYFSNENYATGIELVKKAYQKNLSNGGFPLQSDIFNALLSGIQASKTKEFEVELDFPAKLLALSLENDQLAVYTINGELRVYSTQPNLTLKSVIKTGYVKSYEFLTATEILGIDINGRLFLIDLRTNTLADLSSQFPIESVKGFFKVLGQEKLWVAKLQDGSTKFYQYSGKNGFVNILEDQSKLLVKNTNTPIYWVEGNEFFRSRLSNAQPELIVKTTSTIHSTTWSSTHARWILGLENGQIWSVDPNKLKPYESFAIHATKVSQLVTMPYAHGTELMLSSGFDGGLTFFVFDKNIPFTASVSSRVRFKGHRSWITGFAVDENKRTAYSISNDRTIKVWPLEINKLLTN